MRWDSAAAFYDQLGMLVKTGLPLPMAVRMAGNTSSGWHRAHAPAWAAGCEGGAQLHTALAAAGEVPLATALIRAGELSGNLPEQARGLGAHYRQAVATRNQVVGRLIYPLLLLHVALIVPALPGVVGKGDHPLWLLAGPAAMWAVAGVVIAGVVGLRASPLAAQAALWPGLRFLSMPLITGIVCQVLRGGLSAGLLVSDALELAAGACGNAVIGARLAAQAPALRAGSGATLCDALATADLGGDLLPLIRNGEIAGRLDEALGQVATVMSERFASRLAWTAKGVNSAVFAVALIGAAVTVISMFQSVYLGPINELSRELDGE